MRILLNAIIAKSKAGGGFQISRNFILRTFEDEQIEWYYLISEDLKRSISQDGIPKERVFAFPTQPDAKTYVKVACAIRKIENEVKPDLVYSILAPSYFFFRTPEVMRCCNAWDVIDDDNAAWNFVTKESAKKFRRKAFLCRFLMKRAVGFITQSSSGKAGIIKALSLKSDNVAVVPNVLPFIFKNEVVEKREHEGYNILYVAAPTSHKNFACIPRIASILKEVYHVENARFIVTLPFDSSEAVNLARSASELCVAEMIENVGTKRQSDLPLLYGIADMGFFPSALETFSATLLEYMKFGLPIVASDFQFNRDVTGDAALYFKYDDYSAAAGLIYKLMTDSAYSAQMQDLGSNRLKLFDDFDNYYHSTVDALKAFYE